MSREGLSDFVHAAEHNAALRRNIRCCLNKESIIDLAKSYGFLVTSYDLEVCATLDKFEDWFNHSKIKPTRN